MTTPKKRRNRPRFAGPRKRLRVLLGAFWEIPPLMSAVVEEAARFDWEMMDRRYFYGEMAGHFHPDGILSCRGYIPQWAKLRRRRCPMVCVGFEDQAPPGARIPMVTEDSALVGRVAAGHFIERGFRHVGFVVQESAGTGPWLESPAEQTFREFERHAEAEGAACLPPLLLPNLEGPDGAQRRSRFEAWLKTTPRPVGLLVFRDVLAGHVCALCLQAGAAVPEEVAVLGIGNREGYCQVSPRPLSSVDISSAAQGRAAVKALQRMMTGGAAPARVIRISPAGVVTRRSTDIIAVADVKVARALRFIWEHYAEMLGVNDVAVAVGLSRSAIERRFHRALGRGIAAELVRKRLERCRELLLSTDDSIQTIAPLVGFRTPTYLQRVFRETFGMTPHRWRVANAEPRERGMP